MLCRLKEHQPNGACLSYECQLGSLPGCQYSVLMQWCGFPQADVIVPSQSLCLLVLSSGVDHDNLYQHSGLCQPVLEPPPPEKGQVMVLAVLWSLL